MLRRRDELRHGPGAFDFLKADASENSFVIRKE